jgi:preprotein translocase subunit Sec61beta
MVTVDANRFKFLPDIVVNLGFQVALVEVLEHFLLGIGWYYAV